MPEKKVVITGATSFLGKSMAAELRSQGYSVTAIVRPQSKNTSVLQALDGVRVVRAEMGERAYWTKEIRAADWFVHFGWDGIGAAGRADCEIQKKNVEDALECLRGAVQLGCEKFLFSGSQAEYGACRGIITEETPCRPVLEYGKGKLEFLRRVLELQDNLPLEYIHTRIFSVYGEGDHPWALVPSCIRAFCAGESVELSPCEQMWNFLHVNDAARALTAMLASPDTKGQTVYNVAGDDTRPLREFVEAIRAAAGEGTPLYGERKNAAEAPIGLEPSIQRLQSATGWQPAVLFEEGIRELVQRQREERK